MRAICVSDALLLFPVTPLLTPVAKFARRCSVAHVACVCDIRELCMCSNLWCSISLLLLFWRAGAERAARVAGQAGGGQIRAHAESRGPAPRKTDGAPPVGEQGNGSGRRERASEQTNIASQPPGRTAFTILLFFGLRWSRGLACLRAPFGLSLARQKGVGECRM